MVAALPQGNQAMKPLAKGELPFMLLLFALSMWFYFHGDPVKGLLPALLMALFPTGHPYLLGALGCTLFAVLPEFYGQAGLAVGSLATGFLFSVRRLVKAILL